MYELLIADDEEESRNILSTCFPWENVGFHVTGQVSNGRQVLSYIQSHTVHVVLCDIRMPVLSGIEVAEAFSLIEDAPLLLFLSAHRDFEYARKAITCGVRSYLVKPTKYEELLSTFMMLKEELDLKYKDQIEEDRTRWSQQDVIIHNCKVYIEQNYRTANLVEAAKNTYMNASYLSQLFKQKTGENFSDYLMKIRMEKACELLMNPMIKIQDISNQIGYVNPKNFSRCFKSYYGKSPKEYREGR